ncbi:uncharacterized protein LOC116412862 [Galleria mellonella]|uniref:Uncharacterized protein LOC116412862 n=1 Tax=Galleria mellonella TaxID=7137 RepID=A0ABM3MK63_GALME|nr:uncharacterized protein LOC116412862 [Galleria mellonella]
MWIPIRICNQKGQNHKMPASRDSRCQRSSNASSGIAIQARVYHPATNLMPITPPRSPNGVSSSFPRPNTTNSWSRQNSYNGKCS